MYITVTKGECMTDINYTAGTKPGHIQLSDGTQIKVSASTPPEEIYRSDQSHHAHAVEARDIRSTMTQHNKFENIQTASASSYDNLLQALDGLDALLKEGEEA